MTARTLATAATVAVCLATNPVRPPVTLTAALPAAPVAAAPPATAAEFALLVQTDPVAALAASARRYRAEVRGFRAVLHKQERVGGRLHPPEVVRVAVRERPFAVHMTWLSGARDARVGGLSVGAVGGVLYADGENDGQLLVWRPAAVFAPVLPSDPAGGPARAASRYTVTESGLGRVADRTRRAWQAARDAGRLTWEFAGTRPIPELGGRTCHVLVRRCDPPEVDPFASADPRPDPASDPAGAAATVTVMLDAETWLQAGSELRAADGGLVGVYHFRDVELNPAFGPGQFTVQAFRRR